MAGFGLDHEQTKGIWGDLGSVHPHVPHPTFFGIIPGQKFRHVPGQDNSFHEGIFF